MCPPEVRAGLHPRFPQPVDLTSEPLCVHGRAWDCIVSSGACPGREKVRPPRPKTRSRRNGAAWSVHLVEPRTAATLSLCVGQRTDRSPDRSPEHLVLVVLVVVLLLAVLLLPLLMLVLVLILMTVLVPVLVVVVVVVLVMLCAPALPTPSLRASKAEDRGATAGAGEREPTDVVQQAKLAARIRHGLFKLRPPTIV